QAKKIMDEFLAALEDVESGTLDVGLERGSGMREPGKREADPKFPARMFRNAPKVKNDCIVAEKKQW
ncbi:MAG TPA: hypothetical protein VJK52_04860, partial [Candidatus Nanoarchaeia archaeon]|nr:hypothetical protein [Candidatus Nanoarchaeia archaeon]